MGHFLSIFALLVAFIILARLLRKLNTRIMAKYNLSLALWAKVAVYSVAGVIVAIVLVSYVLRSSVLSTPLGKLVALHWRAGDATVSDCRLCPDGLFIIICDADKGSHISSLRELASLQADYIKNGQEWKNRQDDRYACVSNKSFRLNQRSGAYGFSYDPDSAVPLRQDISFQVIKENDTGQIVEVHYKDGMKDIVDSLFRYEIRNNKIIALESWLFLKYHSLYLFAIVVLASIILLYGGTSTFFRMCRSRRRRRMDERQIT
jgi:hypothetical protein